MANDLPTVRRILLGGLDFAPQAMTKIDGVEGLPRARAFAYIDSPENEFGSIFANAHRRTEVFDNPYIVACPPAGRAGAMQSPQFRAGSRPDWSKRANPSTWLRAI